MTFVLKTRAVTGDLVPARGEHREYTDLRAAFEAARAISKADDVSVYLVDFATDKVMGETYGNTTSMGIKEKGQGAVPREVW